MQIIRPAIKEEKELNVSMGDMVEFANGKVFQYVYDHTSTSAGQFPHSVVNVESGKVYNKFASRDALLSGDSVTGKVVKVYKNAVLQLGEPE